MEVGEKAPGRTSWRGRHLAAHLDNRILKESYTCAHSCDSDRRVDATKPVDQKGCLSKILPILYWPTATLFILLVYGRHFFPSKTNISESSSQQIDHSWAPEGFRKLKNNVAYRPSLDQSTYYCSKNNKCIQYEVVTKNRCEYLDMWISLSDRNKNNIGFTKTGTRFVDRGEKALILVSTYEYNTAGFTVEKITCDNQLTYSIRNLFFWLQLGHGFKL